MARPLGKGVVGWMDGEKGGGGGGKISPCVMMR